MATSLRWHKGRILLLLAIVITLVSLEARAHSHDKEGRTDTALHPGEILSVLVRVRLPS